MYEELNDEIFNINTKCRHSIIHYKIKIVSIKWYDG